MRLIVVAAGTKLPDWVNAGFEDYAGRFTRDYKLELKEIALGQRGVQLSCASHRQRRREDARGHS